MKVFTLEIYTNEPIKVLFQSFVLILVDKLNLSMILSGYKVLQFSYPFILNEVGILMFERQSH